MEFKKIRKKEYLHRAGVSMQCEVFFFEEGKQENELIHSCKGYIVIPRYVRQINKKILKGDSNDK